MTKRKEFEDQIRRQRQHLGNFMKCVLHSWSFWQGLASVFVWSSLSNANHPNGLNPFNPDLNPRYAAWEESQNEFERARSVYERALDVDYRNVTIWLKYVFRGAVVCMDWHG